MRPKIGGHYRQIVGAARHMLSYVASFIERKYTSPIYATFTTGLGVFLGLYGSIYTDEIRSSFPLATEFSLDPPYVILPHGPFGGHSVAFWIGLVVFSLLFFFRQRMSDRQTFKLEELIRTSPPEDVLSLFAIVVTSCHDATLAALREEKKTVEQLEKTIRIVLDSLLTLAQRFDNAPKYVLYGANIMLFRVTDKLEKKEIDDLSARIEFSEPEVDLRKLRGVLDVVPALSTRSNSNSGPDHTLPKFCLPVPKEEKSDDDQWRVLPGAPKAFVTGSLDGYGDARTLHAWCREQKQFSTNICDRVEHYFNKRVTDVVRSFVSIPIGRRDRDTLIVQAPVGVLNIHRDVEGILGGEQRTKMFDSITQPFQSLIMDLLEERVALMSS